MRHRKDIDKRTGKPRVAYVDIWGAVDPQEISRIQQHPSNHKKAILNAYVETMLKGKIPHTYANYEYMDWEFLDHSEADIHDHIERSAIAKRAKAEEDAKAIRGNLLKGTQEVHSHPLR